MNRIPHHRPAPLRRAARQKGVAVITALLLTTLAVTIVASLFWQQQVQVRSMENQRLQLQTKWILRGALDFSIMILRADRTPYTALDGVWATPLADTRLDQYIERERVEGEQFDASLSGNITDACSRYNLRNLAESGQIEQQSVKVFAQLLQNLRMDPALALQAASFVAAGQSPDTIDPTALADGQNNPNPNPGTNPNPVQGQNPNPARAVPAARNSTAGMPVKLLQVDDLLAVPGFTPAIVARLRPFVIVLPQGRTAVNVNTAPPELLAAVVQNLSLSEANTLVVKRKQAPWRDLTNFSLQLTTSQPVFPNAAGTKSEWFLVDSHIRLDRAALNAESLVHRPSSLLPGSGTSVAWIRQY
jgi:general secretion pathway protein K